MFRPAEVYRDVGISVYARMQNSLFLAVPGIAGTATEQTQHVRNRLPEPIDVADHLGNVGASAVIGLFSGIFLQRRVLHKSLQSGEYDPTLPQRARNTAAIGTGVLALAVNLVAETKTGHNMTGMFADSTPDLVDAVYGTVAASVMGGTIWKIEHTGEQPDASSEV